MWKTRKEILPNILCYKRKLKATSLCWDLPQARIHPESGRRWSQLSKLIRRRAHERFTFQDVRRCFQGTGSSWKRIWADYQERCDSSSSSTKTSTPGNTWPTEEIIGRDGQDESDSSSQRAYWLGLQSCGGRKTERKVESMHGPKGSKPVTNATPLPITDFRSNHSGPQRRQNLLIVWRQEWVLANSSDRSK